jgi:hypothetical protein
MLETMLEKAAGENPSPAVSVDAAGSDDAPAVSQSRYKGIAICGSQPVTKMSAPFGDPGWLIYACSPDNSPYGMNGECGPLPRVDQFFELHAPIEDPSRPFAYLNWVASLPFVWMRDARALKSGLFKGALPYPERQLFGTLTKLPNGSVVPTGDGEFCPEGFSSSIGYMIAKAIVDCQGMGIPEIALYGILQRGKQEYEKHRTGTKVMLWHARQRGIKTAVASESGLLEGPDGNW